MGKEIYGEFKVSGIYKIRSLIHSDRCYIGSAVTIWYRWNEHKRLLKLGKHNSPILQMHYNKYGLSDLVFEIIEKCDKTLLIIREQYYINNDVFKGYFNVCKIAGSCLGIKQPMERRIEQSRRQKGQKKKPFTEEHCKNLSIAHTGEKNPMYGRPSAMKGKPNPMKGKKYSEEVRMNFKKPHTQEHKDSIKKSWVKRKKEGKVNNRDSSGRFCKK